MAFGGGYSAPAAPTYVEPEKPEVAKPVTEAATAARDSQKDKAAKASGLKASVLTSPVQSVPQSSQLGQGNKTQLGH